MGKWVNRSRGGWKRRINGEVLGSNPNLKMVSTHAQIAELLLQSNLIEFYKLKSISKNAITSLALQKNLMNFKCSELEKYLKYTRKIFVKSLASSTKKFKGYVNTMIIFNKRPVT